MEYDTRGSIEYATWGNMGYATWRNMICATWGNNGICHMGEIWDMPHGEI